jgi:CheY-like chemotaxis protein
VVPCARVLVVDDVPANRKLLVELVKREGCSAVAVPGGAEALAILASEPFDLVLLDMMMPEVDGLAVLAELQRHGRLPALPVVAVTASSDRTLRIAALNAGAIDFLVKPLDLTEVTAKLRTLIELKRLRDAAAHKMEAVSQLAGGIAHDFNNLLMVISSFTGFVRNDLPEGDAQRADLDEVLKAADRAAGLTRQLLTFARRQPAVKRPTDLNHSLAQLATLLATTVGDRIALEIVPSARSAIVRIDPVQFDQIVVNLAANARDAMAAGGRLQIVLDSGPASSGHGERVRLRVSDTGAGIDERTRARIFEPFFTTKANGKRIGLGLATCSSIVEDAGGTIEAASVVGHGTTFTVELPGCDDPAHPPGAGADGGVTRIGQGQQVLIAEDEPALRNVAVRVLERAGYRVHTAADGTEAIRMLDELGAQLSAIVTDVVMPGCSGYDVAAHAARVAPQLDVILTSGYLDDLPGRPHALRLLWKPVAPRELVTAVAEAVARQSARRHTFATGF